VFDPFALDGLAIVMTFEGRPARAARLFGASETGFSSMGAGVDTALDDERAKAVASARAALGDEEFERLQADGRAMTVDEAVAYALEDEAG
jgi:hypothetical protein